jgi:hypothetical protein
VRFEYTGALKRKRIFLVGLIVVVLSGALRARENHRTGQEAIQDSSQQVGKKECSDFVDKLVDLDFKQFSITDVPPGSFQSGNSHVFGGEPYCGFALNSASGKFSLRERTGKTILEGSISNIRVEGYITPPARPIKIRVDAGQLHLSLTPDIVSSIRVAGGIAKVAHQELTISNDNRVAVSQQEIAGTLSLSASSILISKAHLLWPLFDITTSSDFQNVGSVTLKLPLNTLALALDRGSFSGLTKTFSPRSAIASKSSSGAFLISSARADSVEMAVSDGKIAVTVNHLISEADGILLTQGIHIPVSLPRHITATTIQASGPQSDSVALLSQMSFIDLKMISPHPPAKVENELTDSERKIYEILDIPTPLSQSEKATADNGKALTDIPDPNLLLHLRPGDLQDALTAGLSGLVLAIKPELSLQEERVTVAMNAPPQPASSPFKGTWRLVFHVSPTITDDALLLRPSMDLVRTTSFSLPGKHAASDVLKSFLDAPESKAVAVNNAATIKVPIDLTFIRALDPNAIHTSPELRVSGDPVTVTIHVIKAAILIDETGFYVLVKLEAR